MMKENYIFIVLSILVFIASFLLNKLFLKRLTLSIFKKKDASLSRWESKSKPVFGGLVFFIMFLLALAVFLIFFEIEDTNLSILQIFSITLVIIISFVMGLIDDFKNTKPYFKFILQFLSAAILIYSGIYIKIFSPEEYNYINYILTFLWLVGIMNSFNMLDNMDGITASISATILLNLIINFVIFNTFEDKLILILIIFIFIALIAFLFFNWHPSKMYMGDNGSQFLGAFLAIIAILCFWNIKQYSINFNQTKSFLVIALAFIVPLIDTTTVTINRLLKGKSPFQGGRDHTTHHLVYLGLNERKTAILLIIISLLGNALATFIINFITKWQTSHIVFFTIYFIVYFTILYSITKISKPKPSK